MADVLASCQAGELKEHLLVPPGREGQLQLGKPVGTPAPVEPDEERIVKVLRMWSQDV